MKNTIIIKTLRLSFIAILLCINFGCEPDDENLTPALFPSIAEIFTDVPVNLTDEFFVSFDPNVGANTNGFGTDNTIVFEGSTSIRIDVPAPNDPNGNFIGGIFLDRGEGRNLTQFNALSFYALGSTTGTITVGFGTDFETSAFAVSTDIDLRTGWNKYIIPIPNADRLVQERGMFLFSAGSGSTNGFGFTFWLDEMRFENSNLVSQNGSSILNGQDQVTAANSGSTITISDTSSEFDITTVLANSGNGAQSITLNTAPAYFDYVSSNEDVATVDQFGVVTILSDEGSAVITASLDGVPTAGSLTIMEVDASGNVDDSGNTQIMLPIGFESPTLDYNPLEFGGAPSVVTANPTIGGLNNSTNALQTQKVTGSQPFAGILMDLDVPVDFTQGQQISALVLAPVAGTDVFLAFEDQSIPGAPSPSQIGATATTTVGGVWQELTFDYSGLVNSNLNYDRLVLIYNNGTPGDDSIFLIDDIQIIEDTGGGPGGGGNQNNLLENGDFEQGMVVWEGNGFNVQTDGGNSFNFVDVATAGNPFDVNLSQRGLNITQGETYTLSFEASTDTGTRTMIAGIGLFVAPFTNQTMEVTLTDTPQTFTLELDANFNSTDGRVLFDMGADTGVAVIDNVVLTLNDGSGGGGGELLDNGDFEDGMVVWEGNGFNVQEQGGNNFNFVDVATAGNPFDVNLSQRGLNITEGETYTLSFEASTDTGTRTMIAGIGLFVTPFTNQSMEVTLTDTPQTFTLQLDANFSSADGRVLFDMGADTGVVVIDNVSLTLN